MNDAEMYALLNGYAAGTLTDAERQRLFEKALNNQMLFDALADEESMRAALESPLVRKSLLRLLNDLEEKRKPARAPNRWLWVGLAASIVVGVASITLWLRPDPGPQIVAIAKPAAVKQEAQPQAPAPVAPAAPGPAPTPPPEKRLMNVAEAAPPEPKREVTVADSSIQANAVATPVAGLASAPVPPASRFRAEEKLVAPAIEIFKDTLTVGATASGYLYAFVVDRDQIRPLRIGNPVRPGATPLGEHSSQAEVWYVFTRDSDDVLDRALTGVLPLPSRNWTKVKLN